MSKKRLIAVVAALCLIVVACSRKEEKVAEATIRAATQVCQNNGGVSSISRAYVQGEVEHCGYRCVRSTGRFLYSGNVECNNGANFHLNFTE